MRVSSIILVAFIALGAIGKAAGETVSLLGALVERCDLIDDEYMAKKTGTEARESILRSIRGEIGPIRYESEIEKSMSSQGGAGNFGATVSANAGSGPKLFPPGGKYTVVKSADFESALKTWKAGYKEKDPLSTAELAASYFTGANAPATGKLNETKMLGLFKQAADAGEPNAMFMCGVCYYYGIGCSPNKKKGLKALEAWKYCSGTTKAKRGGWVARRFGK